MKASSLPETTDVRTIARDLLRCASVTPADAGALDVLQRHLDAAGFATHRVPFSEPGTPTIDNLYARLGDTPPFLLFAGHTDVVPPGARDTWRHDPFAAIVENDMLYGRGAQDMKGGIAAFLAATLAFLAENDRPAGSIGFLITGDEEGPAVNGTVKLLDWAHARGERFDACIVGEPTSRKAVGDTLKIGRRGSLNGHLHVDGRQGHVAYPAEATNPIPILLRALDSLLAPLDEGSSTFDASNLEITSVDVGNAATNVIPARARAAFNIRFNDLWTAETLAGEIKTRLRRVVGGDAVRVDFLPCNAPAFQTPQSPFTELVTDAVMAVTGTHPTLSTGGGTSDARFIQRYCPVVELGLVGDTMHMANERVPLEDLDRLTQIYRQILTRFLA